MIDIYTKVKNLIPKQVRKTLRPLYLQWSLRGFESECVVQMKDPKFLIHVNPRNGAVDEYVYMHKSWETSIMDTLKKELSKGDVFVDVGANIGCFTLAASVLVGEKGKVFAFEPIPHIVE